MKRNEGLWNVLSGGLVALCLAGIGTPGALAANATWSGTTDGAWATAGNWSASPVPGTGNTATFNNAGNGNTTLDLGSGVTIARLLFDTVGVGAYTIGSGAVGGQTLTLDNGGGITLNGTVASSQLVNANLTLGTAIAGSYGLTNLSPAASLTVAGSIQGGAGGVAGAKTLSIAGVGNATLSGIIANGGAGSVSVSKAGPGLLILSGTNTYSGNTTAGGGILRADYGIGLPSASGVLYLNGGGVLETTGTIARTLGTAAGNVAFSGSGGFAARGGPLGLTFNSGATLSLGGTGSFVPAYYSLVLGSAAADSVLTLNNNLDSNANGWWPGINVVHNTSLGSLLADKAVLNGSLNWTGGNNANTYWQKYSNGRLEVAGTPGTQNAGSGVVVAGGVLALTGPASLGGFKGVYLAGGDFEVTGMATSHTAKSIAVLGISNGRDLSNTPAAPYGGPGTVTVAPGSGYGARLTAASVSRSAGATVLFRGTSLGTAAYPAADAANLNVTTAAGLNLTGGGGGAGSTTISIVPFAVGDNSATGAGTDFVTHSNNGIRLLTAGEYDSAIADGTAASNNVSLTSVQTVNAAAMVNALRLDNGGGVDGSGTLTLNSGALLALSGNAGVSVGTIALGSKEGVVTTLGDLTVGSALSGDAGMVKAGAGTLTLTQSGGYAVAGTNTVNAGTLAAGAVNALPGTLNIQPGAVVDAAGFDQALSVLTGATAGLYTNSGAAATMTLTNSTDTTLGPRLAGSINLVKTNAGTFAATVSQLANTGTLTVCSGNFQVNFTANNGTIGRIITLDGGGLLYYSLESNQNNGREHAFGDNIVVNAAGGLVSLDTVTGFNPISGGRLTGVVTMNGNLVLTNGPVNKGVSMAWAVNNLTVNGTQALYNNSPATAPYTATLPSNIVGSGTASLTLASGTGAGFTIPNPTATSLDLANLSIDSSVNVSFYSAASLPAYDPLLRMLANGGRTTLRDNRTLTLERWARFTQNDVAFGTNTTLSLYGSNWDSGWTVTNDLTVGGVSNPALLAYRPHRGGLTVTSGALIITNGGRWQINLPRDDGSEQVNANIRLLDGAIVEGNNNTYRGGLARSGGTLTLGNGAPATVTVRGQNGTSARFFQLGYAANVVDSGNVTLRYQSLGTAGQFFNVGWCTGALQTPTPTALRGGSAGTDFAPGSSTLAIVGPGSGNVFVVTNLCQVTTAGTVAFYNAAAAASPDRGLLGTLAVTNGGSFLVTTNTGFALAANATVFGGTLGGAGTVTVTNALTFTNSATCQVWLYGSASNQCGLLDVSNTLTFASGSALAVTATNGLTPAANQSWYVARAPAIVGTPAAPMGFSVEVQGSYLKLTKLSTAGFEPAIANLAPTGVTATAAFLNGNLMSTGAAPVTVTLFWGPADGGSNTAGATWANTNTLAGTQPQGYLSTEVALAADTYYYYRYHALNSYGEYMADPVESFITGDLNVQALADAGETGPVTGLFTVVRAATLTNEDLAVSYAVSGSASNGGDYASLNGTVVIPRGATNATVAVVPVADPLLEGPESVTLTLLPGRYVVGAAPTATVTIADYVARNLTWTDASGSHRWNSSDTNWTDGSAQAFTDGDAVTFDDSAANRTVMIVATVQPSSVSFLNTAAATYRLTNGVVAGGAAVTVAGGGTVKLGLDGVETTTPQAPAMNHSGGTVISNGSVLKYSCSSASQTNALGSGSVALHGGTLNLNYSGNIDARSMWLANNLVIGAQGGALDLSPDGVGNNRRPYWNFPGALALGGTLAVLGNGQNWSLVNPPTFSGTVTLDGDRAITNGTFSPPAAVVLTTLSGADRTLSLQGSPFRLVGDPAAWNVSNLVALASLGIMDAVGVNDVDYLSRIRANGGRVVVGDGKTLTLGRGAWSSSTLAFGTNATISLALGGQGGTARFTDDITIGTNAGQAAQLYWSLGQNEVLAASSGKTLTIGAGGLLSIYSGNMPALMDGNLRFTDGSRFHLTWTPSSTFGRSSGTFYLGDGNAATQETVRITGNMNADNSLSVFSLNYPAGNISDDGNVVLQYESSAGSAGTVFNVSWAFGAFRGGSAGTVFAPAPGTVGFRAIGGAAPATVFTITNTVTVATAGTVGFYNSSGGSIDVQGPLAVTNSGALLFASNGIVRASTVSFASTATWGVTLTGPGTNDCGQIHASGALTLQGRPSLQVTALPAATGRGPWYVATAGSIVGSAPRVTGNASFTALVEGNRILLRPLPRGSVFVVR